MLSLLALGAGIYLGLHFPVLLLVPVTLIGGGAIALTGGVSAIAWPIIFCQAGYMLGLTAGGMYGQLMARLKIRQSRRI